MKNDPVRIEIRKIHASGTEKKKENKGKIDENRDM